MKKQILFILILIIVLVAVGWWLKSSKFASKRAQEKPAVTEQGTMGIADDVNAKYKDKQRYSEFAKIKSVNGKDLVVEGMGSQVGEKQLRIGRGAMIELLVNGENGQVRRDVSLADLQAGQRILYYYVEIGTPIEVVALQVLP